MFFSYRTPVVLKIEFILRWKRQCSDVVPLSNVWKYLACESLLKAIACEPILSAARETDFCFTPYSPPWTSISQLHTLGPQLHSQKNWCLHDGNTEVWLTNMEGHQALAQAWHSQSTRNQIHFLTSRRRLLVCFQTKVVAVATEVYLNDEHTKILYMRYSAFAVQGPVDYPLGGFSERNLQWSTKQIHVTPPAIHPLPTVPSVYAGYCFYVPSPAVPPVKLIAQWNMLLYELHDIHVEHTTMRGINCSSIHGCRISPTNTLQNPKNLAAISFVYCWFLTFRQAFIFVRADWDEILIVFQSSRY